MSNLGYVPRSDTLQVIDDIGKERSIPIEEFWMYEADALPGWITPEEHAAKNGLQNIITTHGEKRGER